MVPVYGDSKYMSASWLNGKQSHSPDHTAPLYMLTRILIFQPTFKFSILFKDTSAHSPEKSGIDPPTF